MARVTAAMRDVAAAIQDDGPALVISHGGSIRTFIHAATDVVLSPLGNGAVVPLRAPRAGGFVVAAEIDVTDPLARACDMAQDICNWLGHCDDCGFLVWVDCHSRRSL